MDKQVRILTYLLLVPIINWILGPLLAIGVALALLGKRQYMDLFVGCALSAGWGLASMWMLAFAMPTFGSMSVVVAIVWFISFYFYNRFLLNWFFQKLVQHEPATVKVHGSIQS
jgi:Na+/phosphate symporter